MLRLTRWASAEWTIGRANNRLHKDDAFAPPVSRHDSSLPSSIPMRLLIKKLTDPRSVLLRDMRQRDGGIGVMTMDESCIEKSA